MNPDGSGRKQLTPNMAMVAKLPVFGETTTASAMAWGFNPYIMEQNQFTGAYLSVVESLSKLVAAGFEHEKAYLASRSISRSCVTSRNGGASRWPPYWAL